MWVGKKSTEGVGNEYVVIYFTLTWKCQNRKSDFVKHFKTEILVRFPCSLQHFYSFLFSCLFFSTVFTQNAWILECFGFSFLGSVKENFLSDRSWALFCFFDIPYFLE